MNVTLSIQDGSEDGDGISTEQSYKETLKKRKERKTSLNYLK
jgi:hypothetical protein